jgi:transposase
MEEFALLKGHRYATVVVDAGTRRVLAWQWRQTGQLEGMNNLVKVTKRIAYGDRDSAGFFFNTKTAFPRNS